MKLSRTQVELLTDIKGNHKNSISSVLVGAEERKELEKLIKLGFAWKGKMECDRRYNCYHASELFDDYLKSEISKIEKLNIIGGLFYGGKLYEYNLSDLFVNKDYEKPIKMFKKKDGNCHWIVSQYDSKCLHEFKAEILDSSHLEKITESKLEF